MHADRDSQGQPETMIGQAVVGMAMGVENIFYCEAGVPDGGKDPLVLAARVDDHPLAGFAAGEEVGIDPKSPGDQADNVGVNLFCVHWLSIHGNVSGL